MTDFIEFKARDTTWCKIYEVLVSEYLNLDIRPLALTMEAIEEWMFNEYGIKIFTVKFKWDTASVPSEQVTLLLLRAGE